uniref:beta-N-acetylhexosaminidase n=1 Tax=Cellulomonas sp. GM13 TaxID=103710 RepID=Q9KI44_9CELL|nr:beta N-acetylglucosaminidase [Cellulomonas sp. GM13]
MSPIALIPRPQHLDQLDEPPFVLGETSTVVVEPRPELIQTGVLTADLFGRLSGRAIEVRYAGAEPAPGSIVLTRTAPVTDGGPGADETYQVVVRAGRVEVRSPSVAGLVHGVVTLRQLATVDEGSVRIPAVRIQDAPRFAWRGLSIDVARHFFGVEDLKGVIGLMAHYKLNVLHLHLTDEQGWRLHVPSRPKLTELSSDSAGGGRPRRLLHAGGLRRAHRVRRGAAASAWSREIDVPGHVNAALHAYGELTPSGEPTDVYDGIEVGFSRLHADLPATRPFLEAVFTDVAAMTAGEHVHIGGDEVLTMEPEEYARFVALAAQVVRAAGKEVVGWQEIAHTPLEPGTVVQYWDTRVDPEPFVRAAREGARLLMSPGSKAYLDMKYDASFPLGLEWAGRIEVRDAYDWEPTTLIEGLPAESVIGVEAAVWTETLRTLDDLTTMLLPRLAAVAEVAWTPPEARDWADFRGRVARHGQFWDHLGVAWYRSPQVDWSTRP